jgi:hypothetical protein
MSDYYTKATSIYDSILNNSCDLHDDEHDAIVVAFQTVKTDVTNLETTAITDRLYGRVEMPINVLHYMSAPPTLYCQWLETTQQRNANASHFFSPTANNDAVWSITVPADAKATQNAFMEFMYAGETTAAGTADFYLYYYKFSAGDLMENGSIADTSKESIVWTPVDTRLRTDAVLLDNLTISAGDVLAVRLVRLATSDSYTGNLRIFSVALKYARKYSVV